MESELLAAGTIVDERYEVLECLGTGGMGTVYKAREAALERFVALKLLHSYLLSDQDSLRRFELEGKILCRLEHPNIARCFRFGIWQQMRPYLIMEYLEGITLRTLLNRQSSPAKPIEKERAISFALQLCSALVAAHKEQILHRDIKPENIFVCNNAGERVKILDFGLAKVLLNSSLDSFQQHTKTGTLVGSVQYMSPEQCRGQKIDERSDIYSLSCVIFELLTGSMPFNAENAVAFLHLHVNAPRPKLSDFIPSGDNLEGLQYVLDTGLAVDIAERYQNVGSLKADLEAVSRGGESVILKSSQRKSRVRLKTPINSFSVVFVLLLFLCGILWAYAPVLELQAFRQSKPACLQIEDKMLVLLDSGRVELAESLINDLKSNYQLVGLAEIEKLSALASGFKERGRTKVAEQLLSMEGSWIDRATEGALKDRFNLSMNLLNRLFELKLELLSSPRRNSAYRRQIYALLAKMEQVHADALDRKLAARALKLYFVSSTDLENVSGEELLTILNIGIHSLPDSDKNAGLSLDKLLDLFEKRFGKENAFYVRALNSVGTQRPGKRYLLQALELEQRGVAEAEMQATLFNLAQEYYFEGKHEQAISYYKQAKELNDLELLKARQTADYYMDNHELVVTGARLRGLNLSASLTREYAAIKDKEKAGLYLKKALAEAEQITVGPTEQKFEVVAAMKCLVQSALDLGEFGKACYAVDELIKRGEKLKTDGAKEQSTFLELRLFSVKLRQIAWAFRACLGRESGQSDWGVLSRFFESRDFSLQELFIELACSSEFLEHCRRKPEVNAQVEELYLKLLARPSDSPGLKFWMETCQKLGLQQTIIEFTKADEFSKEFAERLKREGLSDWAGD